MLDASVVGRISDTYFSPSSEVCRMLARAFAGSLTESLTAILTLATQIFLSSTQGDGGDLADRDVVDLDRRLGHEVEDVLELDGHRVRVIAEVGAAGQRGRVQPGEPAAGQEPAAGDRGREQRDELATRHQLPPTSEPMGS